MKQQVLVISGGNSFDTEEEYLQALQEKELHLDRITYTNGWKENLPEALGDSYEVFGPRMPRRENAQYKEWRLWFEKILEKLDGNLILIGHSLGGIFLAKYLSENKSTKNLKRIFLVAAPYRNSLTPLTNFTLPEDMGLLKEYKEKIFIYHSKDDLVVPFEEALQYEKNLPEAQARFFTDRGHFNQEELPEILEDITSQ